MATIPARCRNCGHGFDGAGAIGIHGGGDMWSFGNTTTCPRCGGIANLADGHFTTDEADALVLLSGPQWTIDLIRELADGLRQIVEENPADPERALRELDDDLAARIEHAVRAGLAAQGKPASQRRRFAKTREVIGVLAWLLVVNVGDVEANVSWVIEQTQTILGHLAEEGEVLAPPTEGPGSPSSPARGE